MTAATDALRRQRRLRIIEIGILILGVADLVLTAGSFMMILSVAVIALMAYSLRVNVRTVRLIQRTHRPRPDYASIARMEREIYGEEFRHEGAPVFILSLPDGTLSQMGEYGTPIRPAPGQTPACWHCGIPGTRVSGLCADCYRMLRGWGVEPRKARPVRYATCPRGHGDQAWSEKVGQWCPKCDEHRSNLR